MAEMLKVEYDELMARAAELEVPLPTPPQQNPQLSCDISFVVDSGTQLNYNASAVRESIKRAEAEYLLLAQSLRNAALAYEEADQAAADALTEGSSATPESASTPVAQKSGGDEEFASPPQTPGYDGYYDLRQAIDDIEAPDQGPAYTRFEGDWNSYVLALQTDAVMQRFRPFEYWEGESSAAVEANFDQQKKYLIQLGNSSCYQIASQARGVVDAHKWAVTVHPTSYELYIADFWYDEYGRRGDINRQHEVLTWYVDMQERSEAVLADYHQRAASSAGAPTTREGESAPGDWPGAPSSEGAAPQTGGSPAYAMPAVGRMPSAVSGSPSPSKTSAPAKTGPAPKAAAAEEDVLPSDPDGAATGGQTSERAPVYTAVDGTAQASERVR